MMLSFMCDTYRKHVVTILATSRRISLEMASQRHSIDLKMSLRKKKPRFCTVYLEKFPYPV